MARLGVFFSFIFLVLIWTPALRGQQVDRRAKVEQIHQLILARVSQELGLSSVQTQKLDEILRRHRERKYPLRRQAYRLKSELREETLRGEEKKLKATLGKLQQVQDQIEQSEEVMYAEVRTLLNPQQLARFVLIMDEIRHEIRAVRRMRRGVVMPEATLAPSPLASPGAELPSGVPLD